MKILKQIIREELEKVLSIFNEIEFRKGVISNKSNPKENVIYDYEDGRAFAEDTLAVDIVGLNRYNLVEYLPKSHESEMWGFEFETVYKTTLMVDIKRDMINGKSVWSLKFGQLYRDEKMPTLISEIDNIVGYDAFVAEVNRKVSPKMDPSKY